MSLTAFAASAHYTKGYLSKVETGRARPPRGLAEICDEVLGANGELVALVPDDATVRNTAGGLSGLPTANRYFVGRTTELAWLTEALRRPDGPPVCVVDGMAGVGKTTLAVAAAWAVEHHFADGCAFLDLRGHTAGGRDLAAVDGLDLLLRLLNVPGERIPPDLDGRANLYRDKLRGRCMLLVLDNARTADQVRPLLPADPRCRVLVTSRHRLAALDEAEHLSIGMLPLADATTLLRAVAAAEAPTDEGAAAEIVARCGRLPLAIRIVAARLRHSGWTAAELRDRLTDEAARLAVMDDGERSVRAAFSVSFEALPADQRNLFGLLALLPEAGAEPAALSALAGRQPGDTDRILDRLHDAHLVTRQPGGYVAMHDLMRTFAERHALSQVVPADRQAAARRLAEHAVVRLAAADALLEPDRYRPDLGLLPAAEAMFADRADALAWLRSQWPTMVRVVELAAAEGLPERCWQIALLLRAFFFREKLLDPWLATHRVALAAARAAAAPDAVGMTLNNLGMAHLERGELGDAAECHRLARSAFAESGNELGATDALSSLAWVRYYEGESAQALQDLGVALAAYRRSGRTRNEAIALRGLALVAGALARFEDALDYAEQARALAPTPLDIVLAVNCVAWILFCRGDQDGARREYATAVRLAQRDGSSHELARALTGLGNVAASRGDHALAHEYWSTADEVPVRLASILLGEARCRKELATGT